MNGPLGAPAPLAALATLGGIANPAAGAAGAPSAPGALLAPSLATLGGLLGAALAALCVVERRHLRELRHRVLFRRWFTWLVIAPLYALAVLGGEVTALALVSAIVFQGLREYAQLVGLPPLYTAVLLAMGLVSVPVALWSREAFLALPPLLLLLGTLLPLLTQDVRAGTRHLAFAALGFGYLPLLLGHLLLLYRFVPGGPGLLLALGLGVALSDVGAFVAGRRFGWRRLAPALSPNKTLAGVAGNVVGAYAGVALMHLALPAEHRVLLLATLPLVVAAGAVWGDLLESLIKREFGAKDAGAWLPGMGGLLDRIDSLILVVPLAYYYLRLVG